MAWLLLLVIFWKPVYNLVMWLYSKNTSYKSALYDWFDKLWYLVDPFN